MNNAKIIILGRLTKDPVVRPAGQTSVCNFSVAVRTDRKLEDGTYATEYYSVSYFGKRGDFLSQDAKKGTMVQVVGTLSHRPYMTKESKESVSFDITATDVVAIREQGEHQTDKSVGGYSHKPATAVSNDDDELY